MLSQRSGDHWAFLGYEEPLVNRRTFLIRLFLAARAFLFFLSLGFSEYFLTFAVLSIPAFSTSLRNRRNVFSKGSSFRGTTVITEALTHLLTS